MKSLDELKAIQSRNHKQVKDRILVDGYQIVVGMGTSGINAGARPVVSALMDEVRAKDLENVTITQKAGLDEKGKAPVVQVIGPKGGQTTYVEMTPEKAKKVIEQHILKDQPVKEYAAD